MQSEKVELQHFALQSRVPFCGSFAAGFGVLAAVVAAGAWQAYVAFDDSFASNTEPKAWFYAGPISLFLASFLGLFFTIFATIARHATSRKFWFVVLWLPLLWLGLGCVVFTWTDNAGDGVNSSSADHLWNLLTIALPMALGAAFLFNFSMLLSRRPPAPVVEPSARWKGYSAAAGRVVGWAGAIAGSVLAAFVSAILLLMASCEPPSLTTLAGRFPAQRHDLETIVQMSDQDSDYSVIDPGWLDSSAGEFRGNDPNVVSIAPVARDESGGQPQIEATTRMSIARWNEYRRIFKRDRITQGIRRSKPSGDAFIMVKSAGLLDQGYSNGFVYCSPGPTHFYPPCSSNESRSEQPSTGDKEAYSFIKLADRWYAYSEGPL